MNSIPVSKSQSFIGLDSLIVRAVKHLASLGYNMELLETTNTFGKNLLNSLWKIRTRKRFRQILSFNFLIVVESQASLKQT